MKMTKEYKAFRRRAGMTELEREIVIEGNRRKKAYMEHYIYKEPIPDWVLDCRVFDVKSVKEFMERYYKPERYISEPPNNTDRPMRLNEANEEHLKKYGYALISRHDSVTGKVVTFLG